MVKLLCFQKCLPSSEANSPKMVNPPVADILVLSNPTFTPNFMEATLFLTPITGEIRAIGKPPILYSLPEPPPLNEPILR